MIKYFLFYGFFHLHSLQEIMRVIFHVKIFILFALFLFITFLILKENVKGIKVINFMLKVPNTFT